MIYFNPKDETLDVTVRQFEATVRGLLSDEILSQADEGRTLDVVAQETCLVLFEAVATINNGNQRLSNDLLGSSSHVERVGVSRHPQNHG